MSEQPPKVSDINPIQIIAYLDEQILKDISNYLFIKSRLEKPIALFSKNKDPESIKRILVILRNSGKLTKDEASLIADAFNEYMRSHNIVGSIDMNGSIERAENISGPEQEEDTEIPVGIFDASELIEEIEASSKKIKVADRKKIKKIIESFEAGQISSIQKEIQNEIHTKDESMISSIVSIVDKYMKTHSIETKESASEDIADEVADGNTIDKDNSGEEVSTEESVEEKPSVKSIRASVKNKKPTKVIKNLEDLNLDSIGEDDDNQEDQGVGNTEQIEAMKEVNALMELGWTKKQIKSLSKDRKQEIIRKGEKNQNSSKFKDIVSDDKGIGLNADIIFDKLTSILEKNSPYKDSDIKVYRGEKFLDKKTGTIFRVVDSIRSEEEPVDLNKEEGFDFYENKDFVLLEGPFNYATGKNVVKKISNKEFGEMISSGEFIPTTDENPEIKRESQGFIDSLADDIDELEKQLRGLKSPKTRDEHALKDNLQKEIFDKRNKLKDLLKYENKESIIEAQIKRFIEEAQISFEQGDFILPVRGENEFIIKHPFTVFEGRTLYTYTHYKKTRYNKDNPPRDIPKDKLKDFQYSERREYKSEDITEDRVTKREYLGILLKTVEIEEENLKEKKDLLEKLKEEIKKRGL